jgi:integrase
MAKVKAPKVPLTEVTVADEEDISRLLRACSPYTDFANARDAAIISLLWATGLRRSELARLTVEDIDLDAMTLVVQRSKNGRSRRVPFDARAAQHLVRYLGKRSSRSGVSETSPVGGGGSNPGPQAGNAGYSAFSHALWLGIRGPLSSDGVRQVIERRRKLAGVTISAHSFRRGLAARALRNGVSQASLMTLAGWETPSMCHRYVRSVATELATDEYRRLMG